MRKQNPAGAVAYAVVACAWCSLGAILVVETGPDWQLVLWVLIVILMLLGVWACASDA